jgi:hypothetical protein
MQLKRHKIYSVTDLLGLEDSADRWIVPQMIPRAGRSLIYGEGGHYKSAIVFDLCVAVASEGLLFNQLPVQLHGPVLLNTTEGSLFDNKDRLLQHIRAHGLHPSNMQLHICQQPFVLDDILDVQELEHVLAELKPVLTVLDPLDSFFSGDENSAKETKSLRRILDRLIDQYHTSVILIHHKGKADNGPRGSTAWTGWADSVLSVVRADKPIPGVKDALPVVTVESTKQRNGKRGRVFSAVPFIDEVLNEIRFAYYDGKDHSGIVSAFKKQKMMEFLAANTDQTRGVTASAVADALTMRVEDVSNLLMELEVLNLAAQDVDLPCACGPGGTALRNIKAWRIVKRKATVDLAAIVVKDAIRESEAYCLSDFAPVTNSQPVASGQ